MEPMPHDLQRLLANGGKLIEQPAQVPIVIEETLVRANFGFQGITPPGGQSMFALFFDVPLGAAAKRYTLQFDAAGLDRFVDQIVSARDSFKAATES